MSHATAGSLGSRGFRSVLESLCPVGECRQLELVGRGERGAEERERVVAVQVVSP
jgi:hypothetical protein